VIEVEVFPDEEDGILDVSSNHIIFFKRNF